MFYYLSTEIRSWYITRGYLVLFLLGKSINILIFSLHVPLQHSFLHTENVQNIDYQTHPSKGWNNLFLKHKVWGEKRQFGSDWSPRCILYIYVFIIIIIMVVLFSQWWDNNNTIIVHWYSTINEFPFSL